MPKEKELLETLLNNRGIKKEDWEKFLNPSYEEHLHDPFLMKDMEKTCVRIFEATQANEKIAIYSDYDCDGIPSAVIIHDFFKKINYDNFFIYIPDRHNEGYGLHAEAIDEFIKKEVKLLITFDLGITAIEEVTQAQASGMDVIITDHHLPRCKEGEAVKDFIPRAYAILNPKIDEYPEKMLCGASVAFKLVQALVEKYGEYWKIHKGWEKWLLDMVGVATLADQVPLLDENRALAYYGLKVLRKGRRLGLVELFGKSGTEIKNISEEDITFTLAPRINAASRMDNPMQAFKLLSAGDEKEAKDIATYLTKINDERKIIVAQIMKEVKKILKKRDDKPIIVIGNPNWHIGVLGIVATKIVEEYKKPAFVWGANGNDLIRGSCRLPARSGNLNLVKIMTSLPENSLIEFGGHEMAGGFSVSHEEIHYLEDRLLSVWTDNKEAEDEIEEKKVDAVITIDDVTNENYKIIEKLAPFGIGNPKPIFFLKKVPIVAIKEFGKEKNHLELTFSTERGTKIKAIAFFKTRDSFNSTPAVGQSIDLIASFEKNNFRGRSELRLRIVDII